MFSIYHTPFFSARLSESLSTPGPPGPIAYSHPLPGARCTLGACVGEVRKLQIPPSLGYGDAGAVGLIPGGATLIFDTEVMGIN